MREADQGQASVNSGDQSLKKTNNAGQLDTELKRSGRECAQCGGLNRVENRCVRLAAAWGGRESQVVLMEKMTLSVLAFPDVSSTFAAVEQSLPRYLKFFSPHHLFRL